MWRYNHHLILTGMERQLSDEKDQHMLQSMELEREVRELRRRTDDSPPPVAKSLPPVATHSLLEKISISK